MSTVKVALVDGAHLSGSCLYSDGQKGQRLIERLILLYTFHVTYTRARLIFL